MESNGQREGGKRLIICCDGTWMNSDNGTESGGLLGNGRVQVPSNVTRISRAITPATADGKTPQIVYYQAGVGTGNNTWDHIVGGGTGLGLSEHIREAYSFIANNYNEGDSIILLGFSRGAYTARSISGLIGSIGLLTKLGLGSFYEIFKDFENRSDPNYRPKYPDIPFPSKPSASDPSYTQGLKSRRLSRLDIPIKAVAVWDTVGSLGIPSIGWLQRLGITPANREYSFYDTALDKNVENAFQALALDEDRTPFSPAVWENPDNLNINLRQCWFPGAHSNIGGGYDDAEMADITLAWMMSQLQPHVEFDRLYLGEQFKLNQASYKDARQQPRAWARGEVYKSSVGFEALAGTTARTPGHYFRPDPLTGIQTKAPLTNTNEHMHASVRFRLGLRGLGIQDKGPYNPVSLKDWKLVGGEGRNSHIATNGQNSVSWKYMGGKGGLDEMPEDELGVWEKQLLSYDSKAYEKVLGVPAPPLD